MFQAYREVKYITVKVWNYTIVLFSFFVFLPFFGLLPRHVDVPRLGVELELQPPAYARATETSNPSHICDLHHSSWQLQILNPLS